MPVRGLTDICTRESSSPKSSPGSAKRVQKERGTNRHARCSLENSSITEIRRHVPIIVCKHTFSGIVPEHARMQVGLERRKKNKKRNKTSSTLVERRRIEISTSNDSRPTVGSACSREHMAGRAGEHYQTNNTARVSSLSRQTSQRLKQQKACRLQPSAPQGAWEAPALSFLKSLLNSRSQLRSCSRRVSAPREPAGSRGTSRAVASRLHYRRTAKRVRPAMTLTSGGTAAPVARPTARRDRPASACTTQMLTQVSRRRRNKNVSGH